MASLHLRVPRSTGTAGDDLVAWGLAVFASEVLKIRVTLRDQGGSFEIDGRYNGSLDEHLASVEADRIKLRWLSSTGKNRFPPAGSAVASVDRDVLRDARDALAQLRAAGPSRPMGGDAPALTARAPAQQYPLYKALTAPGTQWGGYNKLVEHVEKLWTPLGLGLVLRYFDRDNPLPPDSVDSGLKSLGLRGREDRWRNPPGFLYPGLNKGPTMRIVGGNDRWIGPASHLDWLQVDRYDRNIIELYLAYVGYFAVARVLDYKEGRTVAVPAPSFVEVPDILDRLRDVTLRASTIQAYVAGQASLRYAAATVDYLADHRVDDSDDADGETWILAGVHLAHYWKPNPFTFAVQSVEQAPLPRWLRQLYRTRGGAEAGRTLQRHLSQLNSIRGRFTDESKLPAERRDGIDAYARTTSGGVAEWLWAVAAWFPALRGSPNQVYLWTIDDVRSICMALEADLQTIIDDERFKRVTQAIRNATVGAHFARKDPGRSRNALTPQYDLVTTLAEAAHRHPADFLRELCYFVANYNDHLARPNGPRLRFVRQGDLEAVTQWVTADRRGVVPAALLAFGTSVSGREHAAEPGTTTDDADVETDDEGTEPSDSEKTLKGTGED